MTSSFEVNPCPPSHFFKFGNRQKSLGAKSDEYGECCNNSNFNSIILVIETAQVCTGAWPFFQVIGVDDSACIPRNRGHHLAGRFHRLHLLRSPFTFKNPLFWLFLCLWSVVMYPCFVHSYVSTQKLVRIATKKCQKASEQTRRPPRWKFKTSLIPRQYRKRICSTGAVLAYDSLPPARLWKVTWLEVVHRYWRSTGHMYHVSTEICTGSVLELLQSQLLADTWFQNWGCTVPVPLQPSARYQLSSTGIFPCLQLARYCAVCKYWHESDFSIWASCRDSFHTEFFVQYWKHCNLRYACGLNYFTHFDSLITQNHIVDFVNYFGGSYFHWTFRKIFDQLWSLSVLSLLNISVSARNSLFSIFLSTQKFFV